MAKKTKISKSSQRPKKEWIKPFIVSILVLILIVHIAVTTYLFIMVKYIKKDTDPLVIRSLVYAAVDGLRKPAPVNYTTGDSYVPEAKVFIPNSQSASSIMYSYVPSSVDTNNDPIDEEITITSTAIMGSSKVLGMSAAGATAFFESVPRLQACSKVFTIKFVNAKPQFNDQATLQAKVQLQDGRTAYVYKDPGCNADTQELQNSLLKIRSY